MMSFLISVLGILLFLFVFWKKLKDDYSSQIIFSSAGFILVGGVLGNLISNWVLAQWFFWMSLTGAFVGLGAAVLKYRQRFYETFEAAVISALPVVATFFLKDSVINSSLLSFGAFVAMLILGFVYYLLDANYREFSWYRSGKIGFSGLAIAGLFFLSRAGVAIFYPSVLSFVGKSEIYLSGSLAFLFFLMVFNLGRLLK